MLSFAAVATVFTCWILSLTGALIPIKYNCHYIAFKTVDPKDFSGTFFHVQEVKSGEECVASCMDYDLCKSAKFVPHPWDEISDNDGLCYYSQEPVSVNCESASHSKIRLFLRTKTPTIVGCFECKGGLSEDEINDYIQPEAWERSLSQRVQLADGSHVQLRNEKDVAALDHLIDMFDCVLEKLRSAKADTAHNWASIKSYIKNCKDDTSASMGDGILTLSRTESLVDGILRHLEEKHNISITVEQLKKLQPRVTESHRGPVRRIRQATLDGKWNTRTIEYAYQKQAQLNPEFVKIAVGAMKFWSDNTCFTFKPYKGKAKNFIIFTSTMPGCFADVGMIGGPQQVNLNAAACLRHGTATHELAHTFGLYHTHTRPDRDKYVKIHEDNVQPDNLVNFYNCTDCIPIGPYEYGSVLHYKLSSFPQENNAITVEPLDEEYFATTGSRDGGPTFHDIKTVNDIYCKHYPKDCSANPKCQYFGYHHPKYCGKCICPFGLEGDLCEKRMEGQPKPCGGTIEVTNEWTSLTSPNWPDPYPDKSQCVWLIVAPEGKKVKLEFTDLKLTGDDSPGCYFNWVEVRNIVDLSLTGKKFCTYFSPRKPLISESKNMIIYLRSFWSGLDDGFAARVTIA